MRGAIKWNKTKTAALKSSFSSLFSFLSSLLFSLVSLFSLFSLFSLLPPPSPLSLSLSHSVRGWPKKVEKTSSKNTTFENWEHPPSHLRLFLLIFPLLGFLPYVSFLLLNPSSRCGRALKYVISRSLCAHFLLFFSCTGWRLHNRLKVAVSSAQIGFLHIFFVILLFMYVAFYKRG